MSSNNAMKWSTDPSAVRTQCTESATKTSDRSLRVAAHKHPSPDPQTSRFLAQIKCK
jgi:hypothetical protein